MKLMIMQVHLQKNSTKIFLSMFMTKDMDYLQFSEQREKHPGNGWMQDHG